MMDRGRPTRLDTTSPQPPASTSPSSCPQVTVPIAEPVRRKPLPSSASTTSPATAQRLPSLSTGGIVVAVGEDEPIDYNPNRQSFLADPPPLDRPLASSPTLVARDLDQYVPPPSSDSTMLTTLALDIPVVNLLEFNKLPTATSLLRTLRARIPPFDHIGRGKQANQYSMTPSRHSVPRTTRGCSGQCHCIPRAAYSITIEPALTLRIQR